MADTVSPLTRNELAKFLPNERAIRAFENLFRANEVAPSDYDSYITQTKQKTVHVYGSAVLAAGNYVVIADATAGAMTLTLPDAASAYDTVYSSFYVISISKVDVSANAVTIIGSGGDTVVGEVSQDLLADGENITLISDGSNWILAA